MNKKCLECDEKLIGRSDKKFCSDYCRNAYHNKAGESHKGLIRNTNYRLRKNFQILQNLNRDGKTKVSRTKLLEKGFDFEFITNLYTSKAGTTYYFCYNEGYLPLDNDYYLLVRRD